MTDTFRRQLTDYAEYHRDRVNFAMHVFGIIFLFLAAVLPLSLWPVTVGGVQTSAAALMVVPVLIYWLLLDIALGLAIVGAAIALLLAAAVIASHVNIAAVWIISAVLIVIGWALQIVGHRAFERRRPALVDNPSHLLMGPMFAMAKLFIALGFRRDLADILRPDARMASRDSSSLYPYHHQGDVQPNP